jgi:aubergine-like protein
MKGSTAKWQETFTDFVVGKIVLTRYNNTLYKIDDVLWEQTPSSTFTKRGEEVIRNHHSSGTCFVNVLLFFQVSFLRYYKEHHQMDILDVTQPMLLSRVKPRRGDLIQEDKLIALVPELCYITGLTDEERNNFAVMKDLGEHTRLTPNQRKVSLEGFINEINGEPLHEEITIKIK